MIVDVATFIGPYPFRDLGDVSVNSLLAAMDRAGVEQAWVGHLATFLHRDPAPTNEKLFEQLASQERLNAVPTIDPGLPAWQEDLHRARSAGAVAVRMYPVHHGISSEADSLAEAVGAAGDLGMPLILTVRFEDVRQRHPLDNAGDLPAAVVRRMARLSPYARLIVTHASREYIEEVHFGLTPDEAQRVFYDVSWLWGPPADDIDILATTIGVDRLLWASGYPLRLVEAPTAKLDLSDLEADARRRVESSNALELVRSCAAVRVK